MDPTQAGVITVSAQGLLLRGRSTGDHAQGDFFRRFTPVSVTRAGGRSPAPLLRGHDEVLSTVSPFPDGRKG